MNLCVKDIELRSNFKFKIFDFFSLPIFFITECGHSLTCMNANIVSQKLNNCKNYNKNKIIEIKTRKTKQKSYDLFKNRSITL